MADERGIPPPTVNAAWLESLYAEHGAGLRRLVLGVLRDREAAEDVVQATFLKAAERAGEIRPGGIRAWLYRVAFNEAVTRKRRRKVERRASRAVAESTERGTAEPDEALVRREVVQRVREALRGIPEKQQRVVRMRIYDEKTFAQIAEETGTPLGTVLTHMRRALDRLRRTLPGNMTGKE